MRFDKLPSFSLLLLLSSLSACSASPATEDFDDGEQHLAERPVFTKYTQSSGTAAGWFDPARGAVFSLTRIGTTQWVERRWDGAGWTQTASVTIPTNGPSGNTYDRTDYAFAFDTKRGRLLFVQADQIWSWAGGGWTKLSVAHMPSPRGGFAVTYDAARDRLVWFGGMLRGVPMQDTWEYDGNDFTQVSSGGPSTRAFSRMAYDPVRRRVVLFGGVAGFGGMRLRDTWEWDGASWSQIATTGPDPAADWGVFLAWDADRRRVELFGNKNAWEWDGARWTQVAMPSLWPGLGMPEGLAAYDGPRHKMILWTTGRGTMDLGYTSGPNQAPSLAQVQNQSIYAGDAFNFRLSAQDPDGQAVTYDVTPMPNGARMDPSGIFFWTPGFDQVGAHVLRFSASDGQATATRTATFTIQEPVFAPWLPRGPLPHLHAVVAPSVGQTDSYTAGRNEGLSGATASIDCSLSGDNPTSVQIACNVTGTYRRQDRPFEGYYSERYAFSGTSRVNGAGLFYVSYSTQGRNGNVSGKIVQGASGQAELLVDDFRYSTSRRFSSGWTGYSTVRSTLGAKAPFGS